MDRFSQASYVTRRLQQLYLAYARFDSVSETCFVGSTNQSTDLAVGFETRSSSAALRQVFSLARMGVVDKLSLRDPTLLITKGLIGADWTGSDDGSTFEVVNPATGEVVAEPSKMGASETAHAISEAEKALSVWKKKTAKERSVILRKWHDLVDENMGDLAKIITLENGKPCAEAAQELRMGNDFVELMLEEAKRVHGDILPSPAPGKKIFVLKQPIGVVGAITPWNYPGMLALRKISSALAAGCTMVLKPAELTPLSTLSIAELGLRAGFPPGVLNVVMGDAPAVGKALLESTVVRKLTFTGSTAVGKLLMEGAAKNVKKVSLELGGNSPFIVFDDADVDLAVSSAMMIKFWNGGQACISANRIFVQDGIYDTFSRKLSEAVAGIKVGNGFEEGVMMGPLISTLGLSKSSNLLMLKCGVLFHITPVIMLNIKLARMTKNGSQSVKNSQQGKGTFPQGVEMRRRTLERYCTKRVLEEGEGEVRCQVGMMTLAPTMTTTATFPFQAPRTPAPEEVTIQRHGLRSNLLELETMTVEHAHKFKAARAIACAPSSIPIKRGRGRPRKEAATQGGTSDVEVEGVEGGNLAGGPAPAHDEEVGDVEGGNWAGGPAPECVGERGQPQKEPVQEVEEAARKATSSDESGGGGDENDGGSYESDGSGDGHDRSGDSDGTDGSGKDSRRMKAKMTRKMVTRGVAAATGLMAVARRTKVKVMRKMAVRRRMATLNQTSCALLPELQSAKQVERLVQDAVAKGAKVLTGGKRHSLGGTFYEPTVLADNNNSMGLFSEEIFGPVAPLYRFQTEEDVVELANDTQYGLGAYMFTRDMARGWRIAENLEYGMVGWNEVEIASETAPFGGWKQSGLGREGSKYGLEEFLEMKSVFVGALAA
ncbi:hypothetical protein CBR_g12684 [Chara braunii]|uniref:Aldehyde dehydrogenase domain-containing protein n=1 Tax=Chara braunii TaxID=69332 RepID=A0A388KSB4_CHABU|nr:hypothetical protein CBR_g12684 [Chara braunii]|eukprot:GBG72965.1 hypothetical protein CBR_g12684 [Chara braunii]